MPPAEQPRRRSRPARRPPARPRRGSRRLRRRRAAAHVAGAHSAPRVPRPRGHRPLRDLAQPWEARLPRGRSSDASSRSGSWAWRRLWPSAPCACGGSTASCCTSAAGHLIATAQLSSAAFGKIVPGVRGLGRRPAVHHAHPGRRAWRPRGQRHHGREHHQRRHGAGAALCLPSPPWWAPSDVQSTLRRVALYGLAVLAGLLGFSVLDVCGGPPAARRRPRPGLDPRQGAAPPHAAPPTSPTGCWPSATSCVTCWATTGAARPSPPWAARPGLRRAAHGRVRHGLALEPGARAARLRRGPGPHHRAPHAGWPGLRGRGLWVSWALPSWKRGPPWWPPWPTGWWPTGCPWRRAPWPTASACIATAARAVASCR